MLPCGEVWYLWFCLPLIRQTLTCVTSNKQTGVIWT